MKLVRPALALAAVASVAGGTLSFAADAPKTSATSQTLFASQNGCGTSAEAGRLEPRVGDDSADGCGTIGGIPIDEIAGSNGDDYTSTKATSAIKLDAAKKITGQVAAESWSGTGGVGTLTFDVAMQGTPTANKAVDFGTTTVSVSAAPGTNVLDAPFSLSIPASAKGATLKSVTMNVVIRGMNVGMSAKKLNGETWVVIPTRKR